MALPARFCPNEKRVILTEFHEWMTGSPAPQAYGWSGARRPLRPALQPFLLITDVGDGNPQAGSRGSSPK